MKVSPSIVGAIRRIPNKTDFCARYDIPVRTLYNLLEPQKSANRSTLMVVTMALQAEGLMPTTGKKARV